MFPSGSGALNPMKIKPRYLGVLMGVIAVTRLGAAAETASPPAQEHPQPEPAVVRGFMGRARDAERIKAWGANVIRLSAVGRNGNVDGLGEQLAHLRQLGGIKAVPFVFKMNPPWEDPAFAEDFARTWQEIARACLPYRDVIWGFDLLNEPKDQKQLPLPPRQWRDLAIKAMRAIREVDDRSWIVYEVGPGEMFAGFKNLEPLPDARVIYSFHYYFPHEFTHMGVKQLPMGQTTKFESLNVRYPVKIASLGRSEDWLMNILQKPPLNVPPEQCVEWNQDFQRYLLQVVVEFQQRYRVPIYVGEFSTVRWGNVEDSIRYLREAIKIFEENGWSWSYHQFNGFPGWNPEQPEGPEYYWQIGMPEPKPAEKETRRAQLLKEAFKKNRP